MAYITSINPSKTKLRLYRWLYFFIGPLARLLLSRKFSRITVTGTEHLKGEAKLVVMNHSCPLDPTLITFFGREPLQFLITEPFMQGSFGSKIASLMGQITKRKLDLDPTSIQLMKRWSDCGAHVALFPEGQFSWDGSPSPLMPGLDQLIHYLKLPVVCVHLANGSRVKPAWAMNLRKTEISITIHPPLTQLNAKDIMATIQQRLFEASPSYPATGKNLAQGLARHMRFCVSCEADNTLLDEGDQLRCTKCQSSIMVHADNSLSSPSVKSTKELFEKLAELLERKWQAEKSISSIGSVDIFDATKKDWIQITQGSLLINGEGLQIKDFSLKHSDIIDQALDWGDIIILKTKKQRFTLRLPSDSRLVFEQILKKARHA